MLQFASFQSALPSDYLCNLSRCGLELNGWQARSDATERDSRPDRPSLVYRSWSDGGLGMFGTDTGNGSLKIDAEMSDDVVAFAVSPGEKSRSFRIADSLSDDNRGLAIICLPKGSHLEISTGVCGLRSVTLLVQFDALRRACKIPGDSSLSLLDTMLRESRPKLTQRALPLAVQRAAEAVISAPPADPFAELFYRAKASELLWLILDRLHHEEQLPEGGLAISQVASAGVERVRRAIAEHVTRNWTTDELSRIAGMNRTKLRYLFKHIHGMTIFEYRTAIIMQSADEMLQTTDLSVAEIGFRLGYGEPSSFNIAYKRFYGHPPGQARRRH
jgi:AraC-like DNA-binding protein